MMIFNIDFDTFIVCDNFVYLQVFVFYSSGVQILCSEWQPYWRLRSNLFLRPRDNCFVKRTSGGSSQWTSSVWTFGCFNGCLFFGSFGSCSSHWTFCWSSLLLQENESDLFLFSLLSSNFLLDHGQSVSISLISTISYSSFRFRVLAWSIVSYFYSILIVLACYITT